MSVVVASTRLVLGDSVVKSQNRFAFCLSFRLGVDCGDDRARADVKKADVGGGEPHVLASILDGLGPTKNRISDIGYL